MLDLFWVMVDHLRNVIDGRCFIVEFRLDRIYSFGNSATLIFWHFGLRLNIHAHFRQFWEHIPPNDVTCRPNPEKPRKVTSLNGNIVLTQKNPEKSPP